MSRSTRIEVLAAESNLRRVLRSSDPDPALFAIEPYPTFDGKIPSSRLAGSQGCGGQVMSRRVPSSDWQLFLLNLRWSPPLTSDDLRKAYCLRWTREHRERARQQRTQGRKS